ncbi:MAG: RNA-directed DNA polymerase [Candidatus Taylorbacteria bacterium]|nr:RNA-directed DNA polymerase [Candidatus Taylorbacteria bacterium]
MIKKSNDKGIIWLIGKVVESFYSTEHGNGLPLGNLTSQLLVNIYMNEFDQYVKHRLKARFYIRYADDFIFVDTNKKNLQNLLADVGHLLSEKLKLTLHPNKVFIKSYSSGVDFLGWVHFLKHRVLRTSTKNRMFRRLENDFRVEVIDSYLGLLKWGNTYKISKGVALLKKR